MPLKQKMRPNLNLISIIYVVETGEAPSLSALRYIGMNYVKQTVGFVKDLNPDKVL